jgi:hypothetical protein
MRPATARTPQTCTTDNDVAQHPTTLHDRRHP